MTRHQTESNDPTARRLDLGSRQLQNLPTSPAAEPADVPVDPATELSALARLASGCSLCELHRNRTNSVFGTGDPRARLAFVGEGPGPTEDEAGEAFTGRSGKLLDRILKAMGVGRTAAFLTNVVCCRLDDARTLEQASIEACRPLLEAQLQIVAPEVIVPLGMSAWRWFTPSERRPMADVRGALYNWKGTVVAPTYHPAFLLRDASKKGAVWEDMQRVMRVLSGEEDVSSIPMVPTTTRDRSSKPERTIRLTGPDRTKPEPIKEKDGVHRCRCGTAINDLPAHFRYCRRCYEVLKSEARTESPKPARVCGCGSPIEELPAHFRHCRDCYRALKGDARYSDEDFWDGEMERLLTGID